MAEPVSTTTLLTLAGISAGGKILGGIYDRIANRRLYELQDEVLNQQVQFNKDLQRRSRGKFTESELAMIRRNAEPQLQAASGNIAARLGPSSPVGLALLQQAQQAPINAAMQAATAAYGPALAAVSKTVHDRLGQLSGDSSFLADFKAISEIYKNLKGLGDGGSNDSDGSDDSVVSGAVNTLIGSAPNVTAAWERIKNPGSGYQPPQRGNPRQWGNFGTEDRWW